MTSITKSTKDKPHSGTPRLVPRPTAASAARAARNATNRNLSMSPASQRQSPTRCYSVPVSSKSKTNSRYQKSDSRTELKLQSRASETNAFIFEKEKEISPQEDQYLIPDNSVILDQEQPVQLEEPTTGHLENINENGVFAVKNEDDNIIEIHNHVEGQNCRDFSKPSSRPNTPTPGSRPQTPKSLPSSRPQTPRLPSRPTTPAFVPQRHGTPASRPNTPTLQRTPTRPATPASPIRNTAAPPAPLSQVQCDDDEEDVKSVYIMKQKEFNKMKKELDLKQQAILEVFDSLRGLHDRMSRDGNTGCGEGQVNELVLFNVADWTTEEIARLCRDAVGSSAVEGAVDVINTAVPIDECVLTEVDARVMNVPARFADLCLQAFSARQELIDWVKEIIETHALKDTGGGECLERIGRYNAQGLAMCDALRELKNKADEAVDTVVQLSRRACRERSTLIAVGESLVREVARLRQDIEMRTNVLPETRDMRAENEIAKALEETRKELEEEKTAALAAKDKLAATEVQLRQSRIRINKMDRQLREAEASIASLTGTVKTLEDQSRQREVQLEARARKLKESLKTGEVTSGQLAQQRDTLLAEVAKLKEHIENLTTQHKTAIQELMNQLKESKQALEEERKNTQKEREVKESAEAALVESQNYIEDLKAKMIEIENSRPNPDLPTEREMDLWAELQATKDTLRLTEEEVTACKREKNRFLESLTKIAESESKVGMQQKLAAELLSKEETVGKMQIQIRELTKNIKLNDQKVIQYEQYVRDLQAHNRAVANCQETPNGISYQDLQQEIMNLKMTLLEAVHRNEELSEMLVQKEQQLEQQDKTSRAQARVIKVNKQIAAKAEEIQELFTTLENKQQQIHRLEKIVLALEEQQRRAQAQRTRHEEKIAALEHELAAGGNRRERKFLFF